jgi:hypothetical protein
MDLGRLRRLDRLVGWPRGRGSAPALLGSNLRFEPGRQSLTDFDLHIGAPGWISVGFAASIVSSVRLAAEGLHLRSSARTCGSNPGANH